VIIEHGNRYDSWNVISHDALRQVRSALSRNEAPPVFESPAGSMMVVNIMNAIKAKFSFVDLLKPEDASVLPILAVLDPSSLSAATKAIELWRKQSQIEFDENGLPVDVQNIAQVRGEDDELVKLAIVRSAALSLQWCSSARDGPSRSGVRKRATCCSSEPSRTPVFT
jgi:hypothetical protein